MSRVVVGRWLRSDAARMVGLTAAYVLAARFGLFFTIANREVAVVWPAAGIALAGLLLWGIRFWPAVAAGAFMQPLLWELGVPIAAGIALANTVGAVSAAVLLRRLEPGLAKLRDVLALVLVGGVAAPMLSATIGVTAMWLGGSLGSDAVPLHWGTWFAGDCFGVVLVTPLILSWVGDRRGVPAPDRRLELLAGLVLLALASWLVLWQGALQPAVLLIPILFVAARHGIRGATALMPVAAAVAALAATRGVGAFAGLDAADATAQLYNYLLAVSAVGLVTGAAISEREVTADALGAANESQRAILDACPVAIIALDMEQRCTMWSGAAERMFGWSAAEVVGRVLGSPPYVPAERSGEFAELWRRQLAGRAVMGYETVRLRRDGSPVQVSLWVADLRDGSGRPVGLMGVLEDITERRQAEAALRLSEAQLRQAQKMEAVGRLAGGVAHDFNNLLTAILGNAELALEDVADPAAVSHDLREIREAGMRAAALTRQLLAFSRKQVVEPKVLDLNTVVKEMTTMARRLLGADVGVRLELDPKPTYVRADPGQIEQVIINLVVNSRDAMPDGGQITIRTARVNGVAAGPPPPSPLPPGDYVALTVSDTGVGMTPEVQAHLFEPFFTTKEPGKGTGLGLATIHGIVTQAGGQVAAVSAPGQGATFTVYLPQVLPAAGQREEAKVEPAAAGGTETILVVEDDDSVRTLAERVLAGHGYAVLVARDAQAAIALEREHIGLIALLLTDVVMPGRSGRHLAEELRSSRPKTAVLYMSGHTEDPVLHHGVRDAGVPYLEKPFAPQTLLRKVRETLDGARGV